MHNWPGLPVGQFARAGAADGVVRHLRDRRSPGAARTRAMPHLGIDPMRSRAHAGQALQTIVARNLHPLDAAVVSVTQVHAGDTWNVIPERGRAPRHGARFPTRRCRTLIEAGIRAIVAGIDATFEHDRDVALRAALSARRSTPRDETGMRRGGDRRWSAARTSTPIPSRRWAREDFAFMLQAKPGCYVWIGNGPGDGGCTLHNPRYDFNDDALPIGASYWATLTEHILAPV